MSFKTKNWALCAAFVLVPRLLAALPGSPDPVTVTAVSFRSQLSVAWTAAAPFDDQPVGSYVIEVDQGTGFVVKKTVPGSEHSTMLDLPCGILCGVRIHARDALGQDGPFSTPVSSSAPCGVSVTASALTAASLNLSWSAPAIQDEAIVSSFAGYALAPGLADPLPFNEPAGAAGGSAVYPQLQGESRWYRIYAVDQLGRTSSASAEYAVLPPPKVANVVGGMSSVYLRWASVRNGRTPDVTGYAIYYGNVTPDASADNVVVADPGEGNFVGRTLTALTDHQVYYLRVATLGGGSAGSLGDTIAVEPGYASPLISSFAQVRGGPLALTWSSSAGVTFSAGVSYTVFRATEASLATRTVAVTTVSRTAWVSGTGTTGIDDFYFISMQDVSGAFSTVTPAAQAVLVLPNLAAPVAVVSLTGNTRVQLVWDAVSGAGEYQVYRCTSGASGVFLPLPQGATSGLGAVDPDPFNGQENFYKVLARKRFGPSNLVESPLSDVRSAKPLVAPGKPGKFVFSNGTPGYYLTATAGTLALNHDPAAAVLTLSWAPADPGSTLVSQYLLYRGITQADMAPLTVTSWDQRIFMDSGLSAGTNYFYAVQALDRGTPQNGGPLLIRTIPLNEPSQPANFSASVLAGPRASLTWAAPSTTWNPVSQYELYRALSPYVQGSLITRTAATHYVDSQGDTNYSIQYYRLFTRDNLGMASQTYAALGVTLTTPILKSGLPSPVADVNAVSLTGSAALVQWTLNPQYQGVTAYLVYRDGTLLTGTAQSQFFDSPLAYQATPTYQYRVQAVNASGAGVSGTANLSHLPPAPSGLALAMDAGASTVTALHLAWSDAGVPFGLTSYVLYRSAGPFTSTDTAQAFGNLSSTSFVDGSVVPGNQYEYRVAGYSGYATGITGAATSTGVAYTLANSLPVPAALTLTALASGGSVRVDWSGNSATAYYVFRDTGAIGTYPSLNLAITRTVQTSSGFHSFTDTQATAGSPYFYGVAAQNYEGRGPAVENSVTPVPGAPANVTAIAGSLAGAAAVFLAWTAPALLSAVPTQYLIYRATDEARATEIQVAAVTSTAFADSPLALTNTALYYRLTGLKGLESGYSAAVTVTALDLPSVPQGLTATGAVGGVSLAWTPAGPAAGVTAYQIFYLHAGLPLGETRTVSADFNGYSISNVSAGMRVTATVSALNRAGAGPGLDVSAVSNAAAGALAPLRFSAKSGFFEPLSSVAHLELSWSSVEPPLSYQIYRSTASLTVADAAGGSASAAWLGSLPGSRSAFSDGNVLLFQDYHYALTAVTATGLPGGESSPVFSGPVVPLTYPSLVTYTAAVAGNSRVDLAWSSPAHPGSSGALDALPYRLYRYDYSSSPAIVPAFGSRVADLGFPVRLSTTTWADLNAVNGSRYAYYVSVTDGLMNEAPAATGVTLTPGVPSGPPTRLEAYPGNGMVTIQWLAQKSDNSKYNVYRREAGGDYGGPLPKLHEVGPDSYLALTYGVQTLTDDTAVNKTHYYYSVSAISISGQGEGPKSGELYVTPFKPVMPPSGDDQVDLEVINKKDVRLNWRPASDQSSDGGYAVSLYRIYRSGDGGSVFERLAEVMSSTTVTAYSYTDTNTEFGFTYIYRVMPVDDQIPVGMEGISYHLVSVSIPAPLNNVLIFRNSFNPDKGESVPVQFTLIQPGHAWVKIYTLDGRYVATLFEEDVPNATVESPFLSDRKLWDGRNASGQTVASGVYLVHLEATSFRSNARVAVIK